MILRYQNAKGDLVWGDDGGFDLRRIKYEYRMIGDQELFYGSVRGPDDKLWEVGSTIWEIGWNETYGKEAVQMYFQVKAAQWRADHGFPPPTQEEILEARRTGNAL